MVDFAIAVELFESGNLLQAEAMCYQILNESPDDLDALCLVGMINHQLKQQQRVPVDAGLAYHLWYYNHQIWETTVWAGVKALKSPCDMWNYQEIIFEQQPSLIIEFGTRFGGSTLFFAALLNQLNQRQLNQRQLNQRSCIFSVDISHELLHDAVKQHPLIELMQSSSAAPPVAHRIQQLRQEFPGRVFAILDSDHSKPHVLNEMLLLRPLLRSGDYLVVEDSNINGHPVLPGWGEGPFEAMAEYFATYPEDYDRDHAREQKFGFTFATGGFLIRR